MKSLIKIKNIFLAIVAFIVLCFSGCDNQNSSVTSFGSSSSELIPAQTITSSLPMDVYVQKDKIREKVGTTPGSIKVPAGKDRYFDLTGLNSETIAEYQKELDRLGISRVCLSMAVTDSLLKACQEAGLLSNLKVLLLPNSGELTDIKILAGLQSLEGLMLGSCEGLREDFSPLAQLKNLKGIVLCRAYELTDISFLENLKNLNIVSLPDSKNVEDFAPLANLKKLEFLGLPNSVTDQDIQLLQSKGILANLKSFGLHGPCWIKDFSFLSDMKNLETLDLIECVHFADLSVLSGSKNLFHLNLSHCHDVTDLSPLSNFEKLVFLHMSGCSHPEDIQPLAKLRKLKNLYLPGSITDQQLHWLKEKKILKNL